MCSHLRGRLAGRCGQPIQRAPTRSSDFFPPSFLLFPPFCAVPGSRQVGDPGIRRVLTADCPRLHPFSLIGQHGCCPHEIQLEQCWRTACSPTLWKPGFPFFFLPLPFFFSFPSTPPPQGRGRRIRGIRSQSDIDRCDVFFVLLPPFFFFSSGLLFPGHRRVGWDGRDDARFSDVLDHPGSVFFPFPFSLPFFLTGPLLQGPGWKR